MKATRQRLVVISIAFMALALAGSRTQAQGPSHSRLQAGASAIDISPQKLPVIRNGGFLEAIDDNVVDPLHARCVVLDDGRTRLAMVVVDSCMIPRDVCDEAKLRVRKATGIAVDRVLISATHAHSAPSVMNYCLGTMADPSYTAFLPGKIAEAVTKAVSVLQPARAGWAVVDASAYTANRRWITRPDKMREDPFGDRTIRANMHPGHQHPDFIGPSGPEDPALSLLSVQTEAGVPLAILANFSMHYFGGHPGISADYCGAFAEQLQRRIAAGNQRFVGIMSQGTSGDLWWGDYSLPERQKWSMDEFTNQLVDRVAAALGAVEHRSDVTLGMAERRIVMGRRTPDDKRLARARRIKNAIGDRRPRNHAEVYAEQAIYLHENPSVEVVLQAIRIGDLGITAIPCEVYALTGLKIKAQSPLTSTFNIELANGAAGYIPPPEQHRLGGYTTWPARTAGLVVDAEPRIVESVLQLLEEVALEKRRKVREAESRYAKAILAHEPVAYWRMGEMSGQRADDASGHGKFGEYVLPVAFYLPGFQAEAVAGNPRSRAVHLAGGGLKASLEDLGDNYSVALWFWNGLPTDSRASTGTLFVRGNDRLSITGSGSSTPGRLAFRERSGKHDVGMRVWNHVALVRHGDSVQIYLNGDLEPDLSGEIPWREGVRDFQLFFGLGANGQNGLEGKLDEVAVCNRALTADEIALLVRAGDGAGGDDDRASARSPQVSLAESDGPQPESAPLSPEASMQRTHVRKGFALELAAAEPLVRDPVAIDWGADGKLWVAEMADYPLGMDGMGKAGGRIKYLLDLDRDGRYDESYLFMDGVSFPTGVMAWRTGVLVTAAPEIFYAEDLDGDGRADRKEILFQGFMTGNQQLRVNGLRWGLDNWVYCASGGHHAGFGASNKIQLLVTGEALALGSRDMRIQPDLGLLEPCSGPSQFGRVRDDWGNWFGVQNSHPLWHYVLADHYMQRNPHLPSPDPRRQLRVPRNPRVYIAKDPQKRFHSFEQSGRFTSACGPSIYRDDWLFERGEIQHSFTCEPFHNVMQHSLLTPDGSTFTAERADDGELDFFASADRWCRPVMSRTGPDGAIWIVDMYRYMIEHPQWLPKNGQDELRPFFRSGEEQGRIYRVVPQDKPKRTTRMLAALSTSDLVFTLGSRNGHQRDTAQRLLVQQRDPAAVRLLSEMIGSHPNALARLHALCTLEGLGRLTPKVLKGALNDLVPGVRVHAIRIAETIGKEDSEVRSEVLKRVDDIDPVVRLQLALTLGEWEGVEVGQALGRLASAGGADPFLQSAALSSAIGHYGEMARWWAESRSLPTGNLLQALFMMGFKNDREALGDLLYAALDRGDRDRGAAHFEALSEWLQSTEANKFSISDRDLKRYPKLAAAMGRIPDVFAEARRIVVSEAAPNEAREAAARVLGRDTGREEEDSALLISLLAPRNDVGLQRAALAALGQIPRSQNVDSLLERWQTFTPQLRPAVLDTLMQRSEWIPLILNRFETGDINPVEIDAARRQRLIRDLKGNDLKRAQLLLAATIKSDRQAVINQYRSSLTLPGQRDRGASIFQERCVSCHRLDEEGGDVGPNLRSITDRSRESLLNAILDPSAAVEPGYLAYTVTLKNQEVLYGLIRADTGNSVVMTLLDGTSRTLLRHLIHLFESSRQSLMPEGLEVGLTGQDMADLLSFVRGLQSP